MCLRGRLAMNSAERTSVCWHCLQMDIAMACQQQYTIQTATAQGFQSPLVAAVPQTLQVIQTAGPHQVVQQQCVQQQYMFQANQVQSKCYTVDVFIACVTDLTVQVCGILCIVDVKLSCCLI